MSVIQLKIAETNQEYWFCIFLVSIAVIIEDKESLKNTHKSAKRMHSFSVRSKLSYLIYTHQSIFYHLISCFWDNGKGLEAIFKAWHTVYPAYAGQVNRSSQSWHLKTSVDCVKDANSTQKSSNSVSRHLLLASKSTNNNNTVPLKSCFNFLSAPHFIPTHPWL